MKGRNYFVVFDIFFCLLVPPTFDSIIFGRFDAFKYRWVLMFAARRNGDASFKTLKWVNSFRFSFFSLNFYSTKYSYFIIVRAVVLRFATLLPFMPLLAVVQRVWHFCSDITLPLQHQLPLFARWCGCRCCCGWCGYVKSNIHYLVQTLSDWHGPKEIIMEMEQRRQQ